MAESKEEDEKKQDSSGLPPPPISPKSSFMMMTSTRSLTPVPIDGIPLKEWSHERVSEWVSMLDDSDLSQYASLFEEAQVSGIQLTRYKETDLIHLGIDDLKHRRFLLSKIRRLKAESNKMSEVRRGKDLSIHRGYDPFHTSSHGAATFTGGGTPKGQRSRPRFDRISHSESPPVRSSHSLVSSLPVPSRLSGAHSASTSASGVIGKSMSLHPHMGKLGGHHHHHYTSDHSSASMDIPRAMSARILAVPPDGLSDDDDESSDDDSYNDDMMTPQTTQPDLTVTGVPTRSISSVDDSEIALKSQFKRKRRTFAKRKATAGDVGLSRVLSSPVAKKSVSSKRSKEKSKSVTGMRLSSFGLFGGKSKKRHKSDAKIFYPLAVESFKVANEGWLKKRGPKTSDSMLQRYCQLFENGHFFYFKDKPSDTKDEPKGYIDVKTVSKVEFVEGLKFQIIAADSSRVWYFECLSQKHMLLWMTHLKNFLSEDSRISISTDVMAVAMHDLTH